MDVKELNLDLRGQLRDVDLVAKRRVLSKVIEGNWMTRLKGRGIEFAGYRKYTYEDDASNIDWGASLRAKETLVREYESYKSINVFFLLDTSDSMLFTSHEKTKAEYASELVFNLAVSIINAGNSVGLGMFNDDVKSVVDPNIGEGNVLKMINELNKTENYGGGFEFEKVSRKVPSFLPNRALIIIVSDFFGLKEGWNRYAQMFSQRFDLMGIMVRDFREEELPDEKMTLFLEDMYGGEGSFIDVEKYRESYKKEVAKDEKRIRDVFLNTESLFFKVLTREEMFSQVIEYFTKTAGRVKM